MCHMSASSQLLAFLTWDPFAPELRGRCSYFLVCLRVCLHTFLNFAWERDSETWPLERTGNAALWTSAKIQNCLHSCSTAHTTPYAVCTKARQQDNRDTETPFSGCWLCWTASCVTSQFRLPKWREPEKQPPGAPWIFTAAFLPSTRTHDSVTLNQPAH